MHPTSESPGPTRLNRLAAETSPYLLQHADNPVDWYPFGDEAFALARERDVPVLISVGYAACHWCHVMAHESFEDPATAAVMNTAFVNIKVDREERPDVDGIYMDAVQAMTGRGGWPMTVFCTPDGQPFYAGTYFPPKPHHGLPSFTQVLDGVRRAWQEQRADLTAQAEQLIDHLKGRSYAGAVVGKETLTAAVGLLEQVADPVWGGFGGAPKFPPPMSIDFLLRMHADGDERALPMVRTTLDRIAAGGIFDHVGGGFHRYSVDGYWHVPHFEKMLYDNAQLITAFARAWLVTRTPAYRVTALRSAAFLVRELQQPDGGFAASLDADSEGAEGTFYVWSWDALLASVGAEAAAQLGAVPEGNWEGTNVLWLATGEDDSTQAARAATCATLFDLREARTRPGIDDKVIAAWNGMTIGALAEAGRVFDAPDLVEAAERAARFVRDALTVDGRLHRSWRNGKVGPLAFVEDHAILADGMLTLYEATGDSQWFVHARSLCDTIIELFSDPDDDGYFQVGSDAEQPVFRPKDVLDSATPSGNSAAAFVLLRLALFTGEERLRTAAVAALRAATGMLHHPSSAAQALCALHLSTSDAVEIAIIGPAAHTAAPDSVLLAMLASVWDRYLPSKALAVLRDPTDSAPVPLLEGRTGQPDVPTAYVCRNFLCDAPVTTTEALIAALDR